MDTELKSLDLPCGVEEFCKIQARLVVVHLLARRLQIPISDQIPRRFVLFAVGCSACTRRGLRV